MAGQLVHAVTLNEVEPEVNKYLSVISDSLPKWGFCTRKESKRPETYKRNQGLLNSNGHQGVVKGCVHHEAVDRVFHANPVFKNATDIAAREVNGRDFYFINLNEDCIEKEGIQEEIKAHVIGELVFCHNLYLGNKDLPYMFDEAIDTLDRPGTAEALFIMFGKDLGFVAEVVDNHLEDYIYTGKRIENLFRDYGDLFRYVARETPGLDTESSFQGFMKDLHERSGRLYKQLYSV